jgi:hypothetical protein
MKIKKQEQHFEGTSDIIDIPIQSSEHSQIVEESTVSNSQNLKKPRTKTKL